jgi:carbon storage regulator
MLVLSRKIGERIVIEPGIEIAVVDIRGGRVRIGIDAPSTVGIRRLEIEPRLGKMTHGAAQPAVNRAIAN